MIIDNMFHGHVSWEKGSPYDQDGLLPGAGIILSMGSVSKKSFINLIIVILRITKALFCLL